ncbi:mismatch-specific DNA-glycosylase [Enteractinococcus coprophilus]|uniref:G/U mismatch-specific uracil-DNA glycosylase n=1 Tax=Enteractinococcus coprophilus TaxID=1027633 RepID=A0A543AM70_9MICC|nr:mismatch-specific DNA-glycosylase [Enteractinococcus coprophilus]TQL73690.1 G/U mismatch-specific uracil-DNA glycosylase [Enteractinococcus coprophilus]
MDTKLPDTWTPWRAPSPLQGRRPTKEELAETAANGVTLDDVLPYPAEHDNAGLLRLLIVGTNPSPWAASVQAPFARPGNRFWKSLHAGGVTERLVNNSNGMERSDELMLAQRGVGITNIVSRPTSRSSELSREELQAGCAQLIERVAVLRPRVVAFTGITAFRTAFASPKALLGPQPTDDLTGWPEQSQLWVVPDPSGLNAHESVETLGEKWAQVWAASAHGEED